MITITPMPESLKVKDGPIILPRLMGRVPCLERPGRYHRHQTSDAWERCCKSRYNVAELYPSALPYVRASVV